MPANLEGFYNGLFFHKDQIINSLINFLLIIIVTCIAYWLFRIILGRLEKRYRERVFFQRNRSFFPLIKKAGNYCIFLFFIIGIVNLIHFPIMDKIFYAIMVLLIASLCNSLLNELLPYLEQLITLKTETKIDDVIFDLIKRFSTVIIFATAVILALDMLGVNIMPFIAGAGVAGIAIGFAAKDTLSNIIAGILLIIDRPFEVGDRIELWSAPKNSASWGDIVDVGLRATRIRTTDNIVIVIPNNEIMKRDIINYTSISREIRVRIPIGIAYDADVKKAKEIIERVCLELDWVMKEPAPKIMVKSFGESAVNLEARVWINEPRQRMDTISYITDRVKEVFHDEGIEIPFPKRDIYIKNKVN